MTSNQIALGVGALGLIVVSYSLLNHSKKSHQRRIEEKELAQYDLTIDIDGNPEVKPWQIELNQSYEKDLDALAVTVLGDFKVGKTFLINRLCQFNLASIESQHTRGLSFKRAKKPREQLVWIDTAGSGAPYDVRKETSEDRLSTESLLNELAYYLSDVRIVVVSNCKMRDQEFIRSVHQQIKTDKHPGRELLIVVHNYARVTDPRLLEKAFKNDVISQFDIRETVIPYRSASNQYKKVWVDRSDVYPIYHVFLGQEGSPAGEMFNEPTFNAIFDLCVDRMGFNLRHNFIEDTIALANSGILKQHMKINKKVKLDAASMKIVVDVDSTPVNTHEGTPWGLAPSRPSNQLL